MYKKAHLCQFVNFGDKANIYNMRYRIVKEEENKAKEFQQERINAFDGLEARIDDIKKLLRQAKIETIKTYRDQPKTYAVIKPTDLIGDFLKDIETLLEK